MKKLIIVLSCLASSVIYSRPAEEKISSEELKKVGDGLMSVISLGTCVSYILPALKSNPRAWAIAGIFGAGMSYMNQQERSSSCVDKDKKAPLSLMAAGAIAFMIPSKIAHTSALGSLGAAFTRIPGPFVFIYSGITIADAIKNYPATLFSLKKKINEMNMNFSKKQ
jgi:hypothetical protein